MNKTVECDERKIQGIPIVAYVTENHVDQIMMSTEEYEYHIKNKLAKMIADYIMKSDLCEFTQMQEPTEVATTYRCRAFLLTKDCVRELRETHQI
jgi:hypothetical protein